MRYHEFNKKLDVPTLSVEKLANLHSVSKNQILSQLKKGIEVESEHTTNRTIAKEIALDHLKEFPDYYDRLAKAERVTESNNIPKTLFHVTSANNLSSIMKNGLQPRYGKRSSKIEGEVSGIFTFPNIVTAEDAITNWLGDEFSEDDELVLLSINTSGIERCINPGAGFELIITCKVSPDKIQVVQTILEGGTGYIPSKKQANDPRYKTALTKDVKPDTIKKNAKAFGFNVSRAGIPPLLRK